MPSTCQGKGAPCPCSKFKKGKDGKGCRDCAHSKRRHTANSVAALSPPTPSQPPDTVSSILACQMAQHGTNISGLGSLKPLMSHENALQDVLPGFHSGRLASTSTFTEARRSAGRSGSKKKKQTVKSVRFQQIGSLLFLLCGMWAHKDAYDNDKVELRSDKPLTGPEEEELRQEGVRLLVDKDATGCPLEFSPDWSTQAINKWLRALAPKLFQYLDLTYGVRDGTDDQYHWRLVRQQHKRVFLFGKELVSGTHLSKCIGGQARKKETFCLHIATRHPIDKAVWMNFERAIRVAQKRPVDLDFVDTIERRPVIEDYSSEEDSASDADSDSFVDEDIRKGVAKAIDLDAAMEEVMKEDTSSDEEDTYSLLTKPPLTNKRPDRQPLFDVDGKVEGHPNASHSGLNANGKRRATSPPSPPAYLTCSAKRARRALIESPEPEAGPGPSAIPEREKSVEDTSGLGHAEVLFIDGVDFNIPSSPGGFDGFDGFNYYYSPAPLSLPLLPIASPILPVTNIPQASSSKVPGHMIRESPGRPSKSAWKKRNPS